MQREAADSLELSFSPEQPSTADFDAHAWSLDASLDDDEPSYAEHDVPLVDDGGDLVTATWNLRRAITVAAMLPLLAFAEPAHAAPPTESVGPQPSEAPTTDQALMWNALTGRPATLTLDDGRSFRGTVLGLSDEGLVCARKSDGLMVVIDPARISSVHVESLPNTGTPTKEHTGQGLITMGAIATGIGGVMALVSVAVTVACNEGYYGECPYYTIPTAIVSGVSSLVGIPMLAAGLHKRKRARAQREHRSTSVLTPFVAPNRNGVMAGVGLRF